MVLLFIIALALPASGILKSIFFPSDDVDYVYVQVERPQGTSLEETDISMREAEEILYQDPNVASFVSETGAGSSFAGGSFSGPGSGSNIGNITVNLPTNHKIRSADFVTELRKELTSITSASITVGEPAGGPPSSSPVSVTFTGDDLNELSATADRAAHILADVPGVVNVNTDTKNASAEFVVSLDSGKAAELGVSPVVVADTLRTALYGTKATSIRTGKNDIEVYTKLDLNPEYKDPSQTTHATIDDVRALTFPSANGPVPLSSIATVSYAPAQSSISHEAGDRIETVTSDVTSSANAVEVSNEFQKRFGQDQLGKGVTMKVGGASEDINDSFTQLFVALIAGAALMLCILVLEFNSFRLSFYLLTIIPFSLVGVFAGLALVGQPLSLTSMLGVIALAGVIINHAIILMDSISRIHREQEGLSLEDVVVEAASTRLRPILLTTVVTVVGHDPARRRLAVLGAARCGHHVRPRLLAPPHAPPHPDALLPLAGQARARCLRASPGIGFIVHSPARGILHPYMKKGMREVLALVFAIVLVDMIGVGILIPIIPLLFTDPSYPYHLPIDADTGYLLLGALTALYSVRAVRRDADSRPAFRYVRAQADPGHLARRRSHRLRALRHRHHHAQHPAPLPLPRHRRPHGGQHRRRAGGHSGPERRGGPRAALRLHQRGQRRRIHPRPPCSAPCFRIRTCIVSSARRRRSGSLRRYRSSTCSP